MGREINKELMHQIYDYIEEQWYFNSKKPVKKSLQDISDFLKSQYGKEISNPMILYYVKKLFYDGRLKFSREDVGNNAFEYEVLEWGNNWLKKESMTKEKEKEEKNEVDNKKNGDDEEMNNVQLQINNLDLEESIKHIKETLKLIEILKRNNTRYEYLLKNLEKLKPIGTTIEGEQLISAPSNWNLIEILQLIGENKNRDHF